MLPHSYLQIALYLVVLLVLVKPVGLYMARIYEGQNAWLNRLLAPVETSIYRISGVDPAQEMSWKTYAVAMLIFNFAGLVVLYLIQRLQHLLPLNPANMPAVAPDLAFNTAASFASNTDWQSYTGEATLSYFSQMLGLTVQNFASAATGMALLVALIRGLVRNVVHTIGNFWVDLTRSMLYILLPLSLGVAVILVSQGVVQTLGPYSTAELVDPVEIDGTVVATQTIAVGPAASQIAIKQLGTNGGGFFGVNSSHPFENPTPFSNFVEMLSILLIPAALTYTFGEMVGDRRQGWAILAAMTLLFVVLLTIPVWAEQGGNPLLAELGADQAASSLQPGGNMEGKEVRIGPVNSALWATATTAASNGSVNSMHDSYTPLGGLVPMWLMQLGEVVFGGVGSGLYGMLMFAIIAVFAGGLMVGRTPEYLGKKIEAFEMKMASLSVLIPPMLVLLATAVAIVAPSAVTAIQNPGPHGLSETLYAFSSAGNNNGSAFAGLRTNTWFYNIALGLAMLFARYWLAIPVIAMAGSLARKKTVPASPGTLPTHTPLFVVMLIGVVLLVGALTFVPALTLGPIAEYLALAR